MGLLDTLGRIPKILEANVNALLDKCEDPAKMIDQMLVDYKRNLADVKEDTATVLANLEMAKKKLADCDADIAKANKAAENALKAGDEAAAMQIIESKQQLEQLRPGYAEQVALQQKDAEQMRAAYNKLVADLQILEQRRDLAKSKISMAKAQEATNSARSNISKISKSTDTFAKYEEKADRALAKSRAAMDLDEGAAGTDDLISKYAGGAGNASVNDELAAMKARLGL